MSTIDPLAAIARLLRVITGGGPSQPIVGDEAWVTGAQLSILRNGGQAAKIAGGQTKPVPRNRPPTLPANVASGVDSRARSMMRQRQRIRNADIAAGVRPETAEPVAPFSAYRRMAEDERRSLTRPEIDGEIRPLMSSWIRDTVYALAGGPPNRLRVGDAQRPVSVLGALIGGYGRGMIPLGTTDPRTRRVAIANENQIEWILPHEMGHVLDFRGLMPELDRIAADNFRKVPPRKYAATNPLEYKAETFGTATQIIHEALSNSNPSEGYDGMVERMTNTEKDLPGVSEVVQLLLSHPILSETSVAEESRRRLIEAVGIRSSRRPPRRTGRSGSSSP